MKASTIYSKTLKFVWIKLGLGFASFLISVVLLAICAGIGFATKSTLVLGILLLVWVAMSAVANNLINRYFGYIIKAGHVAVVTQAVTTGTLPENQLDFAKQAVTERFATSSIYFLVDRLVNGAVHQLQNGIDKVDNVIGGIPGISAVLSFLKIFVGIALGYVDECCLGYTFYKKEQGACKSAADGVVIYFQNWKILMKNAALLSLAVIGLSIVAAILPFALFAAIFAAMNMGTVGYVIAVILAIFVAAIIKSSFIDSFIMTKMLASYMQTAPTTQITFDLYTKLCTLSGKFKKLFENGQKEQPAPAYAAATTAPQAVSENKFCSGCGAPLNQGAKFCTNCGKTQ